MPVTVSIDMVSLCRDTVVPVRRSVMRARGRRANPDASQST